MRKKCLTAMTMIELLLGTLVIMILIILVGFSVRGLVQRAKVIAAKATINALASCIETIKDDAGLFPEQLSHIKNANAPSNPNFTFKGWAGPYGQTLSLDDPWGNPYFYELLDTVFGPTVFERQTGQPVTETFTFAAVPGQGTLVVANPGVTAGSIVLNGEEVVTQNEFQKITPVIMKTVDLLSTNTISITLQSSPGLTITISITAANTSRNATYTLGSYGRDKTEGGTGYDQDLVYGTF